MANREAPPAIRTRALTYSGELVEAGDDLVAVSRGLRRVARPDHERGPHSGGACRVEFGDHIRDEEDLRGRRADRGRNPGVARSFSFRPDAGIEMPSQEAREISRRRA